MKLAIVTTIGLAAFLTATATGARADSKWQAPTVQECNLEGGADCNVEATCPAELPFVVTGGGGMPEAPDNHRVAMTMNLPVAQDTWRVRWRNMRKNETTIKVAVRIKCASSAAEAGW